MGTPAFDTHAIVCPTCSRPSGHIPDEPINGLYTCPNCKTRIVVCWSGHFVCDPTKSRHGFARLLQRKGQPLVRLVRDIGAAPLLGLFGAIAIGGIVLASGFGQVPERQEQHSPDIESQSELPSEFLFPPESDDTIA